MSSRCCPRCEGGSAAILTRLQGDFPDFRSILILALRVGFMIRPTFLNSRLRTSRPIVLTVAAFACAATTAFGWFAKEWKSGIEWPRPEVVTPGGPGEPPSDAIVLFERTSKRNGKVLRSGPLKTVWPRSAAMRRQSGSSVIANSTSSLHLHPK